MDKTGKRIIRQVAVLGSGVMGSRIACHFANIGVEVLLLDIVAKEAKEAGKTDKASRNKVVNDALQAAIKSSPSPLYHPAYAKRIRTGNFEDNMAEISACDWIVEAVVENLAIKHSVFDEVEKFRRIGSIVSSNTSGIPIHLMLQGRSADFKSCFCGTHFFNPPRYLRLLEIIPTQDTDPDIVRFLLSYGDLYLGKATVLAKDTPAFIANRVGVYAMLEVMKIMDELKLSIDEVDKLTGPVIGHAKSATFRTSDVVGLDTLTKVASNLYDAVPEDESKEMFKIPAYIRQMEVNKWLGDKTGQGFYKKVKGSGGKSEILSLDLQTMAYGQSAKAKFATLELTKSIDNLKDRFKVLVYGTDKAGAFYKKMFGGLFHYASRRIPEIADELYKIDDAMRAGFGWEMGPFETWDALGVEKGISLMQAEGKEPANWVKEMLAQGCATFYKVEGGIRKYYDISSKQYQAIAGTEAFIILADKKVSNKVWGNAGATLIDIGDGIVNLEFHTKMNTLGAEVIEGINKAVSIAEKEFRGLVIGNEGANFSAGANLAMVFMYAIEEEFDEIDLMIRHFQQTIMRLRYSAIPVVVAPHHLTLGGGCEMTLHADRVQAAAETYIGLVELGVGLIPGGGGTKEMALRVSDSYEAGDIEFNALQNAFMNIATAKVSTSAHEAFDMNILRRGDRISVNQSRLIKDAKELAVELADLGYTQPKPRNDIKVQGKGAMATLMAGINAMRLARYISEHDQKVAEKLAYVICGGDLSYPQLVSEQYLLDLEREAFLSLTGERKTLERIQSVLTGGKALRN